MVEKAVVGTKNATPLRQELQALIAAAVVVLAAVAMRKPIRAWRERREAVRARRDSGRTRWGRHSVAPAS